MTPTTAPDTPNSRRDLHPRHEHLRTRPPGVKPPRSTLTPTPTTAAPTSWSASPAKTPSPFSATSPETRTSPPPSSPASAPFARATVGWFDRQTKQYRRIEVDQQCELLSLIGDIAQADDGPQVHAHVVVGLADGTTRGGRLLAAEIWPTLEVIIREAPAHLRKTSHPELGLALIDPERTS